MDTDVITSPPGFRCAILALLCETDWLGRYGTILSPEFFPTSDEQAFVKWINTYYGTYNATPTYNALRNGLPTQADIIDKVAAVNPSDLAYAADVALDFAQVQAMKLAVIQSVDDIKRGDLRKPMERVKVAQRVGVDQADLGMDLIDDMDRWVGEELHGRRYPTGWVPVDNILEGGLVAGEYGLVMAPPGMGKTAMLVNIGYGLAGLLGSTNVLHVTLEVSVEQLLARYAARIAGVRLSRDEDSMTESDFKQALRSRAQQRLRGRLRAIYGRWTVVDIRSAIDNLASSGFQTGALLVDYPDLMKTDGRHDEKRFELADIARDLRQLGKDYGIPVWGASQATRDSYYKDVISMASTAEAIEKAAIADIMITLCQTREEEELNQARLFMAKVRRSRGHDFIPVRMDLKSQAIVARVGQNG